MDRFRENVLRALFLKTAGLWLPLRDWTPSSLHIRHWQNRWRRGDGVPFNSSSIGKGMDDATAKRHARALNILADDGFLTVSPFTGNTHSVRLTPKGFDEGAILADWPPLSKSMLLLDCLYAVFHCRDQEPDSNTWLDERAADAAMCEMVGLLETKSSTTRHLWFRLTNAGLKLECNQLPDGHKHFESGRARFSPTQASWDRARDFQDWFRSSNDCPPNEICDIPLPASTARAGERIWYDAQIELIDDQEAAE